MHPWPPIVSSYRLMEVVGNGEVNVPPDRLQIRIEIKTEDKDVEQAEQKNTQKMNQLIDALFQEGICEQQIQTTFFQVNPVYDYTDGTEHFRGYEVIQQITVILEDIQQTGKVIQRALQNGATNISNLQYALEDPAKHEQRAIQKAVQDAMIKARVIARQLQVHVDPTPTQLIEKMTEKSDVLLKGFSDGPSTFSIQPGLLKIHAEIEATFYYYE